MSVLVRGNVPRTLFSMAFPMLAGTFAMNAYNLTDTWFVAQLGTPPLAAMGFIFPVVMLLTCVSSGIGTGVTTLVSHAIGRHDNRDATTLVTHGMLLIIAVIAVISLLGYVSIDTVFRRLGADEQMVGLIGQYMRIWYVGAIFAAMPMVGNGILISAGDSRAASWFMILGTVLNTILDPIMIFGFFGFPAMGIRGAALATVIAQAISSMVLFLLLTKKHHLLSLHAGIVSKLNDSLRRITRFAIPGVLSMILLPVSATVITRILSAYGNEAVAASGAASRIEMFAFMIPMALGMSLTPFVSQNYGAKQLSRIIEARKVASIFAVGYGAILAVCFFLSAPLLARIFTRDPIVTKILITYIHIISFGYGMTEVHRYSTFFLTGIHKPVSATILNAVRVLLLLIPLSYIGTHYWGIPGVFSARLLTDIIAGCIGLFWVSRVIHSKEFTYSQDHSEPPVIDATTPLLATPSASSNMGL